MRALGRGNESRHPGAAGAKTYTSGDLLHDWPVGGCKRGEKVGGWGGERNSASELTCLLSCPEFLNSVPLG